MAEKYLHGSLTAEDTFSLGDYIRLQKERNTWRRRFHLLLGFSAAAAFILSFVCVCSMRKSSRVLNSVSKDFIEEPYSPATPYIKYINKYIHDDPESLKFIGHPRPELDEAWHHLLEGTLLHYSAEELLQANNATSVRHKEGGFIGGIGLSHDLHCLKRIKQHFHPDYYYKDNLQAWKNMSPHIDHCIESLRQKLLCHADTAVYGLVWTPHDRFKPSSVIPQPHKCVDWASLHDWMKVRAARVEDMEGPLI